MSASRTAPPVNVQQYCVWEGEWPALKRLVVDGRRKTISVCAFVADVFDGKGYATMARNTAVQSDQMVVESSKWVSKTLRENPWVVPATGLAGFSLFVFTKSLRWGVFSATRNSAIATSLALGLTYPHEIRRAVLENIPF